MDARDGTLPWLPPAPHGRGKVFAEAPPKYEEAVVNKYYDITGQILEEGPGKLNIAPETKWAPELVTLFKPTDDLPDEIARQQQKPGLINRNQFTWALVRQGFRFGEKPNVELDSLESSRDHAGLFRLGRGLHAEDGSRESKSFVPRHAD